jgi:prepilin signal peptidase PulO-like enzyme (type II secretory pathway)
MMTVADPRDTPALLRAAAALATALVVATLLGAERVGAPSSAALVVSAIGWALVIRRDQRRVIVDEHRSITAADRWTAVATAVIVGVIVLGSGLGSGMGVDGPVAGAILGVTAAAMGSQAVTDLATHRLPLRSSHLSALAILMIALVDGGGAGVAVAIGAVTMTAIAVVVARLTRGSLGRGDVHLGLPLGAVVGWSAGRHGGSSLLSDVAGKVLTAWGLTAVSAGLVVAVLLITRRVGRTSHIPYGPFMVAGSLLVLIGA